MNDIQHKINSILQSKKIIVKTKVAKPSITETKNNPKLDQALAQGFDTSEIFYHGTGDLSNFGTGFNPGRTGQGNDQLGSGFYFTNKPDTAYGYTTPRGNDADAPGIIPVFLNIRNPIVLNPGEYLVNSFDLSIGQAESIIRLSPLLSGDLDDNPLGNWFDIWSQGVHDWMITEVATHYENSILSIENDFFHGHSTDFRKAVHQVTGHDGVLQHFESGEVHKVAWFPEQVRSIYSLYGKEDYTGLDLLD